MEAAKGAGKLSRPQILLPSPLGSSREEACPTGLARAPAFTLQRTLTESRPHLLGLAIGAYAFIPHWPESQPLSLRDLSTLCEAPSSFSGIGHW